MILEVNNTFDERRIYFLKDSSPDERNEADHPVVPSSATFKNTWSKDFHVSPFNSRKGSYALSAQDPFAPQLSSVGKIDNTITLISSKSHAKLVARIFSTQPSIDPSQISFWARLRFIASWWWVGFVTFPRIVREAGKLFFRRKLHVWYRPEVLKGSIGRRATSDEMYVFQSFTAYILTCSSVLEQTFRSSLHALVKSSNLEQPLKYISPIPSSRREETFNSDSLSNSDTIQQEPFVLKITTPLFYTRLARYSHIAEFLSNEILNDDDKNRTFHISRPELLLRLFDEGSLNSTKEQDGASKQFMRRSSNYKHLQWRFLHWLRNHRHPTPTPKLSTNQIDIRNLGFSHLDHFAMSYESGDEMRQYRNVVTKLLLSDILAFGYPEILDAAGYLLKVLASFLFVVAVKHFWVWILPER